MPDLQDTLAGGALAAQGKAPFHAAPSRRARAAAEVCRAHPVRLKFQMEPVMQFAETARGFDRGHDRRRDRHPVGRHRAASCGGAVLPAAV